MLGFLGKKDGQAFIKDFYGPEATAIKAALAAGIMSGGALGAGGATAGTAGGAGGAASGGFMGSLGDFGKQAVKYGAQSAIQNAFSPQPSQPIMPASNQRITPEFVDYYRKNNMNQRRFL